VTRYDAKFFYVSVLPDIEKNLCNNKNERTLRGLYLHLDNAPSHNTKRPQDARTKAKRVVYLAHFPDAAPDDFFLFGSLKCEMVGFTANSPADILSGIPRIFQKISKETFLVVYDEWVTQLEWQHGTKESTITRSKKIQSALK
jgi:hypothetical protein